MSSCLDFNDWLQEGDLYPLPLSPPLTGSSCGPARLRVDREAAPDTPAQLLSPLAWPSGVVSLNKPERQSPGSAELMGYLSCYKSWGALRPTCYVYPGHQRYDIPSVALFS